MNYIPIVLEQTSNGEKSYDIFSKLLNDRIILLTGEINDNLASLIISQLLYLDSINTKDIYLYINSPGGSINAGMAIYDTMNYITSDVATICIGSAMSMGSFLLAAGKFGKRYSLQNSEIMIHQPYGGMQGVVSDIDIHAKRLLKTKDKMIQLLATMTNNTIDKIKNDIERDTFMNPNEALSYGIVDEVLKNKVQK